MDSVAAQSTRARVVSSIALLALVTALALQFVGARAAELSTSGDVSAAIAMIGPTPAADAAASISPTTNLADGTPVSVTVTTSNGSTIFSVKIHICQTGYTTYGTSTFGYASNGLGTRCVFDDGNVGVGNGITTGGLTNADYEVTHQYSGSETTSDVPGVGALQFKAGSGSVKWKNSSGFPGGADPGSGTADGIECFAGSPCDLVVEASLGTPSGGLVTYFIQPLTYLAEAPVTTTTSSSSTSSTSSTSTSSTSSTSTSSTSTSSTSSTSSTTSTTNPATTTTTHAPTTTTVPATTTTTHASTTTTGGATTSTTAPDPTAPPTSSSLPTIPPASVSSGSGGALAFTGASTRDLASIALVLIAIGLFLLGEHYRRAES